MMATRTTKKVKTVKIEKPVIVTKAPKPPVKKPVDQVVKVNQHNWDGTENSGEKLEHMVLPLLGYSWDASEDVWSDAHGFSTCYHHPLDGKTGVELVDIGNKLIEVQKQLPDVNGDARLTIGWDDWDGITICYSGSRYKTLEEVAKENAVYDKAYAAYEKRLAAYNSPPSKEAIKAEKERKAKLAEIAAKEKEIKDLRKSLLKKRA